MSVRSCSRAAREVVRFWLGTERLAKARVVIEKDNAAVATADAIEIGLVPVATSRPEDVRTMHMLWLLVDASVAVSIRPGISGLRVQRLDHSQLKKLADNIEERFAEMLDERFDDGGISVLVSGKKIRI